MVENTELPLTLCSEMIQTVSITGSSRIRTEHTNRQQSFIQLYATRHDQDENMMFSEYVYKRLFKQDKQRSVVAHFVGMNNTPCFPVSPSYARSCLILYVPWRNYNFHRMNDMSCIQLFYAKMNTNMFPSTVKLNYLQAVNKSQRTMLDEENGTENRADDDEDDIDDEDLQLLAAVTSIPTAQHHIGHLNEFYFDQGLNYDWSVRHTVSLLLLLFFKI